MDHCDHDPAFTGDRSFNIQTDFQVTDPDQWVGESTCQGRFWCAFWGERLPWGGGTVRHAQCNGERTWQKWVPAAGTDRKCIARSADTPYDDHCLCRGHAGSSGRKYTGKCPGSDRWGRAPDKSREWYAWYVKTSGWCYGKKWHSIQSDREHRICFRALQ